MASVPPPATEVQGTPPFFLTVERMCRVDACPEACGNAEAPYRIEDTPDGFRAYYGCEDCGQFWQTAWRDR